MVYDPISPIDASQEGMEITILPDGSPGFTLSTSYLTPARYFWYRAARLVWRSACLLGALVCVVAIHMVATYDDTLFLLHRYFESAGILFSARLESILVWCLLLSEALENFFASRRRSVLDRRLSLRFTPGELAMPPTLPFMDEWLGWIFGDRTIRWLMPSVSRWDMQMIDGFDIREHPCRDKIYRREKNRVVPGRIFQYAWEIRMSYKRHHHVLLQVCERDKAHAIHGRLQQLCSIMQDPQEIAHWEERRLVYDPFHYWPLSSSFSAARGTTPGTAWRQRLWPGQPNLPTYEEALEVLRIDDTVSLSPQILENYVAGIRQQGREHPAYLELLDKASAVIKLRHRWT